MKNVILNFVKPINVVELSQLDPNMIIGFVTGAGPDFKGFVQTDLFHCSEVFNLTTAKFILAATTHVNRRNLFLGGVLWDSVIDTLKAYISGGGQVFVFDNHKELFAWLAE